MMYLGVDIGGTAIKIGLIDVNGNIIKKNTYNSTYMNGESTLLNDSLEGLSDFIKINDINLQQISGIGISATGQISEEGKVIGTAGHIPDWLGVDIKKEFENKFNISTKVVNDANSMVIAEKEFGVARGCKDVVGITIGTGVGGGIIVNGKLLTGADGIAGEVGHILINECEIKKSYNRAGSFEDAASTSVLVKMVENIGYDNIDGKIIFDELLSKEDVKKVYEEWINNITRGLVSLIHIFNPEIVVVGGGISVREEFIDSLRTKVLNSVMPSFAKNLKIKAASLGNDAGLLGSVCEFR